MVLTSAYDEIFPTASVAMPTSCRMRSANGVWKSRPYTGLWSSTVCPAETSMASQPCARNARATSTASSGTMPPGDQSTAEMRTLIGFAAGHAARTASNTSSGKRSRRSSGPPYSSVRWFVSGEMKLASR